jgi:hypothetical protein
MIFTHSLSHLCWIFETMDSMKNANLFSGIPIVQCKLTNKNQGWVIHAHAKHQATMLKLNRTFHSQFFHCSWYAQTFVTTDFQNSCIWNWNCTRCYTPETHTIQLAHVTLETNSTVQLNSNKNDYTMFKETATSAAFKKTDISHLGP